MVKDKLEKPQSRTFFLSNFALQIILLVMLVGVVVFSYLKYPLFWNNHWLPVLVTASGLGILTLLSFWRDLWRKYRWIAISVTLILIVLIDTSWTKSTLDINALEKLQSVEYSIPQSKTILHAEYPIRALYDSNSSPRLVLWLINPIKCPNPTITISSDDLFFSIQGANDSPSQWKKNLEIQLPPDGSELTVLLQPVPSDLETTKESKIVLMSNNTELQTTHPLMIELEGKRNAQDRFWLIALTDTGSISLIIGIAIAWLEIQRKEEEEKRKREETEKEEKLKRTDEIKREIENFDDSIEIDFSKALVDYRNYLQDWTKWDEVLQKKFRERFTLFVDDRLWEVISDRHIGEIEKDIERCLQLCKIMSTEPRQLKLFRASLQQEANALLTLLKEYPESIATVKQIAGSLPDELKKKILNDYKNEFLQQIFDIKDELGFIDLDNFPLQRQFHFYAHPSHVEGRLSAWVERHRMHYSPFIDTVTPYTLIPTDNKPPTDNKMLIELVTTGFKFPILEHHNENFEFSNSWDIGAALFEYTRNLPWGIKNDSFVILLTPTIIANFDTEQPRKLFLHALAEQWLWVLAETPTIYYSLSETQRALLGRLLRWHGGSPFAVANILETLISTRNNNERSKNFLGRILEWLHNIDATPLRPEEFNTLIKLRPSSKTKTRLLITSVDLNPQFGSYTSPELHKSLDKQAESMGIHGWSLIHFLNSDINPQKISLPDLERQCQLRMLTCSGGKVESLEELFIPHEQDLADLILARKANGSPGKMVELGQRLLLQHMEKYSPDEDLHIEDLITIK